MRELSKERRRLIDGLVERAFDTTAQTDPSAALREEVTATLEAALADPDVAGQLEAGTLLRAVRWSGFGAGGPALTAVSARSTSPRTAAGKSSDRNALRQRKKQGEAAARRAADREGEQNRQRQLGRLVTGWRSPSGTALDRSNVRIDFDGKSRRCGSAWTRRAPNSGRPRARYGRRSVTGRWLIKRWRSCSAIRTIGRVTPAQSRRRPESLRTALPRLAPPRRIDLSSAPP
jgi:hypothetical protein